MESCSNLRALVVVLGQDKEQRVVVRGKRVLVLGHLDPRNEYNFLVKDPQQRK